MDEKPGITEVVKAEANKESESNPDKQTLLAVLQFLKKHNLKDTQELLQKEAKLKVDDDSNNTVAQTNSEVSAALSAYKSEGDPSIYEDQYLTIREFIEESLDTYKCELSMLLYPLFVHLYLELVYNEHESKAKRFFIRFSAQQEDYLQEDLRQLRMVTKKEHMEENEHIMENFRTSKYVIRMSRDSYTLLKRHLQAKKKNFLLNLIQEHLYIDVFDGIPRNKKQITAVAGALGGEARRDANKVKVFFGLLKEPDLSVQLEEEEEAADGEDKPKKKKPKKELFSRKAKNDPNAPSATRIPLPELTDADKLDKIHALREAAKRVKLGEENLPSICFYTFANTYQGVSSAEIAEDSSMMAAGFADGVIRVWTLTLSKLRCMKPPSELSIIDTEADDVLERMMDDRTSADVKVLYGHSGPVYATRFSHDRKYLISCSEDTMIRMWSLLTYTCLVCYKGHTHPVWDVKFSPHGYYFASGGRDKAARVWATDQHQPVRIFAGHLSDVDCVQFHPNSNYVATGSSDRTVRLWDVLTGNCVRYMTGHKAAVQALCFTPCGKMLASAGADSLVLVWSIQHGNLVAQLSSHTDTIYSLAFSREGRILATGGIDNCVKLWNMQKISENMDTDDLALSTIHAKVELVDKPLASYHTKSTPVICLHFTRRNLLMAAGAYVQTTH
ncbi:PREDICTED: transcription initiation factor TFIID subunit 5-like [Priapulus caudatus]|uniref:Transcription initiation factor TFIID subunit 5-like n=1 Tax=Priapulus caudatus TaxID=37621 RepID=A0ABM1F0F5_PRICU|nr:PREDICTED: transcription initiation factor TFIID subunit 5-like [Priapulus caudatus]